MPTVPAIPNADRVLDATATAAQDTFTITWPVIADSELLAVNDLVVLVDGAEVASADFSFDGNTVTGLIGIWNGGSVILDTPCAGGERVIIYSKRDPRRTGYFLEGKSLPFTELDKLEDDQTIMMRDLLLGVSRSVKLPIDDYLDGENPDDLATEILAAAETVEGAAATVAGLISGVIPMVVLSATTTAPPVSPTDGDAYAIPAGASGVWAGHGGQIALRESGAWNYLAVLAGHRVSAIDTLSMYAASSGKWTGVLTIPLSMSGGDFAAAHTIAASLSHCSLEIDCDATLAANITITVPVIHKGGHITMGDFDLTFDEVSLLAGATQIFVQNGTGRVKGTIVAPEILADWWNDYVDSTSNRKAWQSATDYVNQSTKRNADLVISSRNVFTIDQGIVSTATDQPNFLGQSRMSATTPDSLNVTFSPGAPAVALKMVGGSAPCGGGIHGVYFDGNANLTAIEINNCVDAQLNVGFSATVGRCIYLHNISGGYNENTKILAVVPGLGPSSIFLDMDNDTGTNSFSGTTILPGTAIALNAGDRGGVPVIKSRAGAFVYNGGLDVHLHNHGAFNFAFYQNIGGGSAPTFYRRFNMAIETGDNGSYPDGFPVVVVDPAQEAIYGSVDGVFLQGGVFDTCVDISALISCDYFAYPPSGVISTKGARVHQQRHTFFANDGVILAPAFGGRNHIRFTGYITNPGPSGNAYRCDFSFETCVETGGAVNGAVGNILLSLGTDAGGYGTPDIAMDASHRPVLSKGTFPVGVQWIAVYDAVQL